MTTAVRLGPFGARWHCVRCGDTHDIEGPWFLVEKDARLAAAAHVCSETNQPSKENNE